MPYIFSSWRRLWEDYDHVEGEVLRLFRDLHVADPLHRSKGQSFDSHKSYPLQRFLQQSNQPASTRSGPSSTSGSSMKSFRTSSSYRFGKPASSAGSTRQAYVVEELEEDDGQEEELVPDDVGESGLPIVWMKCFKLRPKFWPQRSKNLKNAEMWIPQFWRTLKMVWRRHEKAAESLVTMREARARISDLKKDRGFGLNGNQVEKKKTRTQCWDCGEYGHWGGDSQCQRPGAGLLKSKGPAKKSSLPEKQVKVVESLNTEHVVDDGDSSHEVMMVHHDSVPFVEAF